MILRNWIANLQYWNVVVWVLWSVTNVSEICRAGYHAFTFSCTLFLQNQTIWIVFSELQKFRFTIVKVLLYIYQIHFWKWVLRTKFSIQKRIQIDYKSNLSRFAGFCHPAKFCNVLKDCIEAHHLFHRANSTSITKSTILSSRTSQLEQKKLLSIRCV